MKRLVILLALVIPSSGVEKPLPETEKFRLLSLYEKVALLQVQRDQVSQRLFQAIKDYNSANQKVLKDYPEGSSLAIDIDKQDVTVTPKQEKK